MQGRDSRSKVEFCVRGAQYAIALCVLCLSARAQTFLQYVGQPGDGITGGQSGILQPPDWSFILTNVTANGVHFSVTRASPGQSWTLDFDNGTGQPLAVGTYLYATRWPLNPPGTPGLAFGGNGNGCNTLTGKFVVSEIQVGPGNQLLHFAADFEQHCEDGGSATFGAIRYNSSAPVLITRLINASVTPASLYYVSMPGDSVGGGVTGVLTQDDGFFSHHYSPSGEAHVSFAIPGFAQDWHMDFDNGVDAPLTPGLYLNAVRYPFNPPGTPGLSITANGNSCNTVTGTFLVSELEVDPLNHFTRLAIDFEQHCEGQAPALFGSLRIRSDLPPMLHHLMGFAFSDAYCFGDACPCGNDDNLGGCKNASGAGATLTVGSGTPSLAADDLELLVTGLPPHQCALLFEAPGAGQQLFGNGRYCLSGPALRLGARTASASGTATWSHLAHSFQAAYGPPTPTDRTHLQAWYRDPHGPCGASTNLSNALSVTLAP